MRDDSAPMDVRQKQAPQHFITWLSWRAWLFFLLVLLPASIFGYLKLGPQRSDSTSSFYIPIVLVAMFGIVESREQSRTWGIWLRRTTVFVPTILASYLLAAWVYPTCLYSLQITPWLSMAITLYLACQLMAAVPALTTDRQPYSRNKRILLAVLNPLIFALAYSLTDLIMPR